MVIEQPSSSQFFHYSPVKEPHLHFVVYGVHTSHIHACFSSSGMRGCIYVAEGQHSLRFLCLSFRVPSLHYNKAKHTQAVAKHVAYSTHEEAASTVGNASFSASLSSSPSV